jgi:hypothetical protein
MRVHRPDGIQCVLFPGGGYVLHRLPDVAAGLVSAWFSPAGSVLDASQRTPRVERGLRVRGPQGDLTPIGVDLERCGRIYGPTPAERDAMAAVSV